MKLVIMTDAWEPQINGVVRTLSTTIAGLEKRGHAILRISPEQYANFPCPTYPEIRLALARQKNIGARIRAFEPTHIHISTEGPLGVAARSWCVSQKLEFTTAFHTRFAEYAAERTHLPTSVFWRFLRWFHRPSSGILTATPRLAAELAGHGLTQTRLWSRGVDTRHFRPGLPLPPELTGLPRPWLLNVGRVAAEKNLDAFLSAAISGTIIIVGDGPARAMLEKRYPGAIFVGSKQGDALAAFYAHADVFVFPSRTDTFGLVMLEAMACGTPVAAFPVAGPLDVIGNGFGAISGWSAPVGGVHEDIRVAMDAALQCNRTAVRRYAEKFSWDATLDQFERAVQLVRGGSQSAALLQAA